MRRRSASKRTASLQPGLDRGGHLVEKSDDSPGSTRGDEKGNAPRLRKLSERSQTPHVRLDQTREMPFERLARSAAVARGEPVEDLKMLSLIDLFGAAFGCLLLHACVELLTDAGRLRVRAVRTGL